MKSIIITSAILFVGMTSVAETAAHGVADNRGVSNVEVSELLMERTGDLFAVDMNLGLSALEVKSNRAVLLTPVLINERDTLELQSIGVYGRTRYYYYVRNGNSMLAEDEQSYRAKDKPESIKYHQVVGFKDWMNGAELKLRRKDYGCCKSLIAQEIANLGEYEEFTDFYPALVYENNMNVTDRKERSIAGSAYIDFRVNKTDIDPDYRNNIVELGRIGNTIDSLRVDGDITIDEVWFKGYASPEGKYDNNARLAIGRTDAVKSYVGQLYSFPDSVMNSEYEPENWVGLKAYLKDSNISERNEIIEIIDSDMAPDPKEMRIKSLYPDAYRVLLADCYPALRRTDYRIAYSICTYADVEDIKRVMETSPWKLSLNEFYMLSQEYEPGSDEFTEVFETAARMYPNDEVANLNAANAAMRRMDLVSAGNYLRGVGDSPKGVYAKASYKFLCGNYERSKSLFKEALDAGVVEAEEMLKQFDKRADAHAKMMKLTPSVSKN